MTIVDYAVTNNLSMLKKCCKEGDENNTDGYAYRGVLHWAVIHGNEQMLTFWLGRWGCNVDLQTGDGNTPLHEAVKIRESVPEDKRRQMIKILLAAGADYTIKNRVGETPLSINSEIATITMEAFDTKYIFPLSCVSEVESEMESDEKMVMEGYECEEKEGYQPLGDFVREVPSAVTMWPEILKFIGLTGADRFEL